MTEPNTFSWGYHKNHPHDIPALFPYRAQFLVLKDVFHDRGGPFQRFISWADRRYVIVMEPNKFYANCLENDFLEKLYRACEEEDIVRRRELIHPILHNCMTGLWSYLEKDLANRQQKGTLMKPIGHLDYDRTEVHKLQLKTVDGTVHAIASEAEDDVRFRPVENTFPGVRCFPVSEIEVLERITRHVFRVRIHGQEYCLKAGDDSFVHAVRKLQRVEGKVSNVLSLQGVAVDKNDRVIGMISSFVHGKIFFQVRLASTQQKNLWKEQISTAVKALHQNGVVWGDANPHNILINSENDEAVLIDLEGGWTDGWVDEELCDTIEGDVQALDRILCYIDSLSTDAD